MKLIKSKYSNLELQIVKQYSKKKNFNTKIEIKLTEVLLNKIANITYLYHVTGKTILFLGFPTNFNKILKSTKHLIVPEFMWQNNMFSNNISFSNNDKKARIPKNIFKLKTKLKKKIDLIIINNVNNNKMAFKESYLARIPAVTLTEKLNVTKIRSSYNSTGSYNFFAEKEENMNFFFRFMKSVLLRAKKCNQKLLHRNTVSHARKNKKKKWNFKP
jgi:hypothetical protein